MKKTPFVIIGSIIFLLLFAGCGYHNPYRATGVEKGQVITIYMGLWENKTNELNFENLLYSKTADWLQQSRHLRIVANQERADYILSGKILSVDYPATAYTPTDVASTLLAKVRTSYQLTERMTGKSIWQVEENLRQSDYQAGSDAVRSQSNKQEALATIADEIGEQIYLRVTATLTSNRGK